MLLMIDNYDSFTFNLVQALEAVPGVKWTIRTQPGGPAALVEPAP